LLFQKKPYLCREQKQQYIMEEKRELLLEALRQFNWELCHKENPTEMDIKKIHECSVLRTKLVEENF